MITIKTDTEIELMRQSSQMVAKALAEVAKLIKPGVTTLQLDQCAEAFIRDNGAVPAFLGYGGFPNTLCTSVNEVIVHGIPSNTPLRDGDIVSVDCGVLLNGFYGDSAYTFAVGEVAPEVQRLMTTTKESLFKAIEIVKQGCRVGDIGHTIQTYCQSKGYSVVREMIGHGVGRSLHEEPEVPNYGKRGSGPLLKKGMVIAIEPMINLGRKELVIEKDGWTARTKDRKHSAHYEHTVAVCEHGADVLSTFEYVEKALKDN